MIALITWASVGRRMHSLLSLVQIGMDCSDRMVHVFTVAPFYTLSSSAHETQQYSAWLALDALVWWDTVSLELGFSCLPHDLDVKL